MQLHLAAIDERKISTDELSMALARYPAAAAER
jgi:hypothetical protein